MEQAASGRRCHQARDADTARRLSKDRDIRWVASEPLDICVNPAQRRDLVEQAVVSALRVRCPADLGEVEESERSQAIIECHDDYVAALRSLLPSYQPSIPEPITKAPP